MTELLIIGVASLDVLHLRGQDATAPGGAGMYTALASACVGARTTLFAPRPAPMPESLHAIAARVNWIGPPIAPDELPRLEIAHYGGGNAKLLNATWGGEARLTPENLPDDLSRFAFVHLAALSSAQRQMDFLRACRERGATKISVGTYARVVQNETEIVRALFDNADLFFCNENEARGLFGSIQAARTRPGNLLFITRGEHGAYIIEENRATDVPGIAATELDPTGAGDTFCGATLSAIAQGASPIHAAREAHALAARMIQANGPAALLRENSDPRIARIIANEK